MTQLFRRLPLSFKLILIGIIPLAFIIFLTWQVYEEKNKNIRIIKGYIDRVNQIGDITTFIHEMQQEQKLSFDVLKKGINPTKLIVQRSVTDSILNKLRRSNDYVLKGFEEYTSLKNLKATRNEMDSGRSTPDRVTHFYSNTIFRLNTLTNTPYGSQTVLEPFYNDIQSQKLLTELNTYLGIIRTNIYNVLTTRQYMIETLMGTVGTYDVYNSYEMEFKLKASPHILKSYTNLRNNTDLKASNEYIHQLFKTFKFDSTYTAEQWWTVSENGLGQLAALREGIWADVNENIDAAYKQEINKRNRSLILLILITALVLSVIAYTIIVISRMLRELKLGAEKIAHGGSGLHLNITSKDAIGSLADSIAKIDENNKQLTDAADEIGKGNFQVPVQPRSDEDILANAILKMKENLQSSIKVIEESELRFKQLADMMPQIVWTTDAYGKPVYYNKQWYLYAGNKDSSAVIHPADAEIAQSTFKKAMAEGTDYEIEIRLQNQITNQYRWFLVRAIPIKDGEGNITKWFGTSTDIHEGKTTSEELEKLVQKRTAELKRSNDDLLQFAHVASHDMKEPLRKVRFFTDRLTKDLGEGVSEKSKSHLLKITTSSERLMLMIEGVLEFSTINNDERPFSTIDLNKVIEGVISDLELTIHQKDAVITYGNLPSIKGVPVLIHQLFYNLITNALKFSKTDIAPVIAVSAKTVMLDPAIYNSSIAPNDQYLEVKIEDNGIGFDDNFSSRIFDVFARLHTRDKYEGTGLGLALCKKIMERHNGYIYVTSEEGKGSVFHLLFHENTLPG